MRTQLQAISLRIQTVRTNEQMMTSMKGATQILGSMNRQMNLPQLQRIAMEFERENDIMDQRQEMMDDAIDDMNGPEEEGETDEVVEQVLEEIGVDLKAAVRCPAHLGAIQLTYHRWVRHRVAYRVRRCRRRESPKQLAEEVVRLILETMIYRLGLTA